jgi:protein-tyrosine phosphatase
MVIREVVPGLFIGTKLVPPVEYVSLGVDAIVDLEPWDYAWVPPVPDGCIYLSFPIGDDDVVDPKTREVAEFVAALVRGGRHVLVHCTEGLNRSGLIVGRALMFLGMPAGEAIELVRDRRGPTEDEFRALFNERFVDWLLAEEDSE